MILLEAMWHWHCWLTIDGISSLTLVRPVDAFVSRCYGQPASDTGRPQRDKAPPDTDTRIS